jgi:MFS family permease
VLLRLRGGGRRAFGSLAVPNYRRYFGAVLISSSGTWLQLVAESWLVLRLRGSGFALGITTALAFMPQLLFGTYGGVLVDRWAKRALLTGTQTAAGLLALAVGVATVTQVAQIWMVWLAALLLGFVNVVDSPGRQAFAYELVGPDLVATAVSLKNAAITSARAIGPAIGGALIATVGIAPCFLINAASYAVVVLALLSMDAKKLRREANQPTPTGP